MWSETQVTQALGIKYPIIQGPFGGGFSSIELLAEVSNSGGLGSFGAHNLKPDEIGPLVAAVRAKTSKPFAVNLWVSVYDEGGQGLDASGYQAALATFKPYYDELGINAPAAPVDHVENYEAQVEALIKARPPVFSFVFGIPSADILARCKQAGIKTLGAATTVAEAVALENAGVDMVLATGFEAGGHRPSFLKAAEQSLVGMLALVPQVRDAVSIPVIAAGGIGDARGIAAAFMLGADAVQLGTAFLACQQSNTTDFHRQKIRAVSADDTVLSRAYTGRLARFMANRFVRDFEARSAGPLPFPLQAWFTGVMKKEALRQDNQAIASLYAGQGAPLVKHRDAGDLMQSLVADLSKFFPKP